MADNTDDQILLEDAYNSSLEAAQDYEEQISVLKRERDELMNALKGVLCWVDTHIEHGDQVLQELIDECNDARELLEKLEKKEAKENG